MEIAILAKNIKIARATSGLSQKQLADKIGISEKTISAYETGRAIPPSPTLAKIADVTGVSTSQMVGMSEPVNNDDMMTILGRIESKLDLLLKEK